MKTSPAETLRAAPPPPPTQAKAAHVVALFVAVLGLAVAVVALTLSFRSLTLDAETRAALAVMSVPRAPVQGEGGFRDLYLAEYDVPAGADEAAFAAELAFWSAMRADGKADRDDPPPPRLLGTEAMPQRPPVDRDALCPVSDCYEHVRENAAAMRARVDANAERLARVERAIAAAHLRSPFPERPHSPMPAYQQVRLILADAALDAVEGRTGRAYTRTCTLLASMRRLSADGDQLLDKMVGGAFGRGAAELLLALRRHHPVDTLPVECAEAIAPLRDAETSICTAARGEYRLIAAGPAKVFSEGFGRRPFVERMLSRVFFDPDLLRAWEAADFADLCSPERAARARRGLTSPPIPAPGPPEYPGPACLATYLSCVYANLKHPRYDDYAIRTLDDNARLRLLLAGHAIADGALSPHAAVAAATVEGYPVRYDATTGIATIDLRMPAGGPKSASVDLSGLAPPGAADAVIAAERASPDASRP
jgi:hypothetical protein